jgi:hypothetical protein
MHRHHPIQARPPFGSGVSFVTKHEEPAVVRRLMAINSAELSQSILSKAGREL